YALPTHVPGHSSCVTGRPRRPPAVRAPLNPVTARPACCMAMRLTGAGAGVLDATPPRRRMRPWWSGQAAAGWAFVGPSVALLAVFTVYPLLYSLWLSLQDRHLFGKEAAFVGLGNFTRLLASAEFWSAFWNGTLFSVATVVLQLAAGVATALLLHNRFRGRALVRGVILFPFVMPTIVAVLVWKWMLN